MGVNSRAYKFWISLGLLTLVVIAPTPVMAMVEDDVDVTADVRICELQVIAHPAGRIPRTNNWGTLLQIGILNSANTSLANINITTNNLGQGTTNLCALGINIAPGTYNFYVRGRSHLRRLYTNVTSFNRYRSIVDFTNELLIPGETSVVFDNYINALDLSTQIVELYTADIKNDLNADGQVNALDLSLTVTNLYLLGE